MPTRPPKPDPYSTFRNDKERRNALISRDIRLVLIALVVGLTSHPITQTVLDGLVR